jgi:hypothetical protein
MPNKWDSKTKEQAVRLVVKTPQMTTPLEWANDYRRSSRDELRDTYADGYENIRLIRARSAK